jgi:hypothetical protein
MATPISPTITPATRRTMSFSSPAAAITTTVNSGVVALRIEASPLGMVVCPITISENGSTLLNKATAKNGRQPEIPFGNGRRKARSSGSRINAASATRSRTNVKGGNSRSTTPLKKNDPPHSTESAASSDQSRTSIRPSLAVMSSIRQVRGADAYPDAARPSTRFQGNQRLVFGRDTISIILPSSSSGACVFAVS